MLQLFLAYDKGLSRFSRSFILVTSLVLNIFITGFYCQDGMNEVAIAIRAVLIQKVLLVILNLLMVKRPKKKIHKYDKDLRLKEDSVRKDL